MKRYLVAAICLVLCLQSYAQTGSAPKRYGQENSRYSYPLYGNVESILIIDFDITETNTGHVVNKYVSDSLRFNNRGDLLEHGGNWGENDTRYRHYYIYDDHGNNLLTLCATFEGGAYNVKKPSSSVSFYISNDRDGEIAEICFDEAGKYNPNYSTVRTSAESEYKHEIYKIYNSQGLLTQEDNTRYYYDSYGRLVKKREYSDVTLAKLWYEWKYDANGREIEAIMYSYNSEILNTTYTTYNGAGQKTCETNSGPHFWIGDPDSCGACPIPRKTIYRYDEIGKLIEEVSTMEDYSVITTRYTYDRKGNVIEERRSNSNNNYCSGTKYVINYRH